MSVEPKYPDVEVQLTGEDSNTGAIMLRVTDALRAAGHKAAVNPFRVAVFDCGSYDDVLNLVMDTVSVS